MFEEFEICDNPITETKEQLLLIIADLNDEIDDLKHQLKLATDKDYRLDWINNEWLPRNGLKNVKNT